MRVLTLMLAGILLLLALKYVVLGLNAWDMLLHPGRVEPADSLFLKPFFGLFQGGSCGNCNA